MNNFITYDKTSNDNNIERVVNINGVAFEEKFIAKLIADHLQKPENRFKPTLTTALKIYLKESRAAHHAKFQLDTLRHFTEFVDIFGDMPLEDLRHWHIVQYRDLQLTRGLKPASIRKKHTHLNAMLNMSFKYLDIDRLSPFRGLYIPNEGKDVRPMIPVTDEVIRAVKKSLLNHWTPYKLVALVQLNTGMRLSEPIFAKLEDCVLEHEVPHLWVRPNKFSDRKTKSSIRAVPLVGVSLDAAKLLVMFANDVKSEWLVPHYARHNGSGSCSAAINKHLKNLQFRSHMFRHALVDRLKACDDIQTKLAESITGHSSMGSEFDNYGTIGYTLEQKQRVLERIMI